MVSQKHLELIAELERSIELSWAHRVLYRTLLKLRDGGPTQYENVVIHDSWTGPGDRVNFLYQPPWIDETIGLSLGPDSPWVVDPYAPQGDGIDQYAWSIADFNIAEPLGRTYERLERDANGTGWWGDLPLPGILVPKDIAFWERGWR